MDENNIPNAKFYYRDDRWGRTLLALAFGLACVWMGFEMLDPNWEPSGWNNWKDRLFLLLPSWTRASLYFSLGVLSIIFFIGMAWHQLRLGPYVIINGDSVTFFTIAGKREVLWNSVERVSDEPSGWLLHTRRKNGKETKRRIIAWLIAGTHAEVHAAIYRFRPDLVAEPAAEPYVQRKRSKPIVVSARDWTG